MAIQKYSMIRGSEASIVAVDTDPGREDATAQELATMNGAADCIVVRDAAHEAALKSEAAQARYLPTTSAAKSSFTIAGYYGVT